MPAAFQLGTYRDKAMAHHLLSIESSCFLAEAAGERHRETLCRLWQNRAAVFGLVAMFCVPIARPHHTGYGVAQEVGSSTPGSVRDWQLFVLAGTGT